MCLVGGLTAPPPPLPLLLLLLLLCPPAVQGDCSLPPEVPNALLTLGGVSSFPEGTTLTYKCNEGFVKVPGKADSVVCLNNAWSELAEFCNRSCDVPTRLLFASLKTSFTKQNYFPEGSIVEYDCRPGYRRDYSLSGKLTCLQNFTWSKPDEFCKRKSCPNPGDLRNGRVSIPTDILYGASISFSCNEGYRLVGVPSSYCSLVDDGVGWSDPLPECQEIFCPEPPEINNGFILDLRDTYVYQQAIKYRCKEGFTLIGENSIYCTVKGDQGEWSGPPPECKGSQISKVTPPVQKSTTVIASATKPTSTPQKPTTTNVPSTKAPSTRKPTTASAPSTEVTSTQKPTTVNVSGTKVPTTPQKPTTINAPATKAPSTLQKSNTVNVPATEVPSTPQKPNTISSPATEALPTPQKPNTVHVSATKFPSTSQKPNTVHISATKAPSTPQKPDTINSSATEALPTPQKPNTVNVSATKAPSTPQKLNTINSSATEALPTPQKPNTINSSAAEALPTLQKPNTVNVSATKTPSTPQKPNTLNVSATKSPSTTQKPNTVHVSATKTPSTLQKLTTVKDSATAKKSPISNAQSTETPPAAQNPIMANVSATQAMPATHRSTTVKASFTQSLPATRKSTAVHAPVTKGLHTTKRLTSAHITAKQSSATPRTTNAPKGKGTVSSDAAIIAIGLVAGTVIGTLILVKIFWHYGKSGTHMCNTDSLVYDASNHWLADLAEEELRRKCTQVHRKIIEARRSKSVMGHSQTS
ncbi:complement decay-accelerating factor isoform X2 [Ursus arctos]|uniref:complement decay-accelerating factor isoform X2 n=1 Tax=Ursus arctos TaxID=9644 RepID=UPI00254811D6|nr:complement decay-accelerating factor isoform X2 [Ursus arctos]